MRSSGREILGAALKHTYGIRVFMEVHDTEHTRLRRRLDAVSGGPERNVA